MTAVRKWAWEEGQTHVCDHRAHHGHPASSGQHLWMLTAGHSGFLAQHRQTLCSNPIPPPPFTFGAARPNMPATGYRTQCVSLYIPLFLTICTDLCILCGRSLSDHSGALTLGLKVNPSSLSGSSCKTNDVLLGWGLHELYPVQRTRLSRAKTSHLCTYPSIKKVHVFG